ncbi:MAG TPA: hypothetical protein VH087_17050 [Thermoanaerobaculia bacterium]|jgi:hypothetical protein|nr:hypothetical protein [Thermoanaerobaculia bacterium]
MTQKPVTREQAVAIAELIKEQCDAAFAELVAMPKPDPEVIDEFRTASYARRTARRLRSGEFRPATLKGTPEELARKYDYAAEYADKVRDVRRLAKLYKKVQMHIASETFADVRGIFHRMKEWLRDPNLDDITAENIIALHRERRRDLGRPKKKGPKIGEGGLLVATGAPAPNRS